MKRKIWGLPREILQNSFYGLAPVDWPLYKMYNFRAESDLPALLISLQIVRQTTGNYNYK
jgi:hypothetical protein